MDAIPKGFQIVTKGIVDPDGKRLIDHCAISAGLRAESVDVLRRFSPDGTRLSDHIGVLATLKINEANKTDRPSLKHPYLQ